MCDEIINAADTVSTNGSANVMSTVSSNFHNKKVRYEMDCYMYVCYMFMYMFIIMYIYYYIYIDYYI